MYEIIKSLYLRTIKRYPYLLPCSQYRHFQKDEVPKKKKYIDSTVDGLAIPLCKKK